MRGGRGTLMTSDPFVTFDPAGASLLASEYLHNPGDGSDRPQRTRLGEWAWPCGRGHGGTSSSPPPLQVDGRA